MTFTGETATGWQQATLLARSPVTANTTYVASYHAPVGRYAADQQRLRLRRSPRGPLTALANGTDGANGVYRYGGGGFPTNTFQASNYWVDVVFDTTAADTTPPTVIARTPAAGATGVPTTTAVTATFSEPVTAGDASPCTLTGPGGAGRRQRRRTTPATPTATFTPAAALARLDDLHRHRSAAPRTPPATRWPR